MSYCRFVFGVLPCCPQFCSHLSDHKIDCSPSAADIYLKWKHSKLKNWSKMLRHVFTESWFSEKTVKGVLSLLYWLQLDVHVLVSITKSMLKIIWKFSEDKSNFQKNQGFWNIFYFDLLLPQKLEVDDGFSRYLLLWDKSRKYFICHISANNKIWQNLPHPVMHSLVSPLQF